MTINRLYRVLFACFYFFCIFLFVGCTTIPQKVKVEDIQVEKQELVPHFTYILSMADATESFLAISSIARNEAAVNVSNGGKLILADSTIEKTFEPALAEGEEVPGPATVNAGVYAELNGVVDLNECKISTANSQGKGLFVKGPESSITMRGGEISTNAGYSYGVFAAYGGTLSIEDVLITARGPYSSVIATDPRSYGNIDVKGGTYITSGQMSAGICSNGKVTVTDAKVRSNEHGVVMNGEGQVILNNVKLSAGKNGAMLANNEEYKVAPVAVSYLSVNGGTITAHRGDVFQVMHDKMIAYISVRGGTKLVTGTGNIINVIESGKLNFTADGTNAANGQEIFGNIVCDETGSATVKLVNNSSLTGAINPANSGKEVNLILDATSNWNLTEDSFLTTLLNPDGISDGTVENINGDGHTIYYSQEKCPDLGGKTYALNGGGFLMPR